MRGCFIGEQTALSAAGRNLRGIPFIRGSGLGQQWGAAIRAERRQIDAQALAGIVDGPPAGHKSSTKKSRQPQLVVAVFRW